jgi:hypothetical protein
MSYKHGIVMVVAAAAALLGAVTVTKAGMKVEEVVSINTATRQIKGALGSVRNTADSRQYMGVSMEATRVGCSARDANGTYATCSAESGDANYSALRQVVASASNDSWIACSYNSSGVCTSINVINTSYYAPKLP